MLLGATITAHVYTDVYGSARDKDVLFHISVTTVKGLSGRDHL